MSAKFQMAIRLDEDTVDALDRIAAVLSERAVGVAIPRSEALRQALVRGIPALEAELGVVTKPKRKTGRR